MTPGMSQPEGASPETGGASPAPQGGQAQANPLQEQLAKVVQLVSALAQQNAQVQPELMEVRKMLIKALQKTMMGAQPQQQQSPAPQA